MIGIKCSACGELLGINEVCKCKKTQEEYDFVDPTHYKNFSVETIDMMVAIWGEWAVIQHCEMNAFKYKMRLGTKPDQPVERDLEKANWYLNKAKELREKLKEEDPLP